MGTGVPPPRVVILEQGVFSRDSSLRSRMTARENAAVKDLAWCKCYFVTVRGVEDVAPYKNTGGKNASPTTYNIIYP